MRLAFCALVGLALLSACGGSSTANPTATLTEATVPAAKLTASQADQETPVRGARILSMDMLTENQGWVLTPERLAWTNDGGETWTDITPPEARGQGGSVFLLDERHGWLATAQAGERGFDGPSIVTVYRTSDGGTTWELSSLDGPHLAPDSEPPGLIAQPQFVDVGNGWLIGTYVTGNRASLYLARTSDGGATWTEFEFTEGGAVAYDVQFVNPRDGWMTILGPSFLVTHDGGESWQPESLQLPNGCETRGAQYDAPKFLDRDRAVLRVRQECDGQHGTVFYVTEDGGVTWRVEAIRPGAYRTSILTFNVWLDTREDQLFETADGGKHWSDVTGEWSSFVSVAGQMSNTQIGFDFADQGHGWAFVGGRQLLATSDGGRTWEIIYP